MGFFDFFKGQQKNLAEFIEGIGWLTYSLENNELAYRGKVDINNFNYKIELDFPTNKKIITPYQKNYFTELVNRLDSILLDAVHKHDNLSTIDMLKVKCIMIPDKMDDRFDINSEIVVTYGKHKSSHKNEIYSIILVGFNIEEIIDI